MNSRNTNHLEAVENAIREIASDNISGAAEILRLAGVAFTHLNAASSEQTPDEKGLGREHLLETCVALASAQPQMTSLLRLAQTAWSAARVSDDSRTCFQRAEQAALEFIARAEHATQLGAMHAAALIREGGRVLTHSRSSTVLAAFLHARQAGISFSVVATESRPMFEGRTLAAALARESIPVTLIADAAAGSLMNEVDLVLIGADTVTPSNLVNKIGTRMIALAAHECDLPLYGVCDSSKFINQDYYDSVGVNSKRASELWDEAPAGVTVINRYFEITPLELFKGVVTEAGVLSIVDTARRAEDAVIDRELLNALGVLR